MALRRHVVPVTVDASGDATAYSPVLSGDLISIRYVKDTFANGVDFTITAEDTGETIWAEENVNASATRYPRAGTATTAGAASLYAAAGTAVNGKISLSQDRVKIVVASGGNATAGTFHITVDG
jgi:hypothetical protein